EDKTAILVTSLPEEFHYRGEPTAWVRMTRPGERLHSFLEGLAIAPDGSLYLADVPHGRIFRIAPDFGSWFQIIKYDGKPHGLALTQDGNLLIADYRKGILRFNLESQAFEVICAQYNTENFRGLSDLVSDTDGNIWFTDSGRTSLSDPTGRLFKLASDG